MVPAIYRPEEGGEAAAAAAAVVERRVDLAEASQHRVTSFILNILDVGFCLEGSRRHHLVAVEGSDLDSSSLVLDRSSSLFSSNSLHLSHSHSHSLATSTGLLVELVPVLREGLDKSKGGGGGGIEEAMYCFRFLPVRDLAALASRYKYDELAFALEELLQHPVELLEGGLSSDKARTTRALSGLTPQNSIPSLGNPLFASLASMLDKDTEKNLYELFYKNVEIVLHFSSCAELRFK
jgi:hypothetical protein